MHDLVPLLRSLLCRDAGQELGRYRVVMPGEDCFRPNSGSFFVACIIYSGVSLVRMAMTRGPLYETAQEWNGRLNVQYSIDDQRKKIG